MLILFYQKRFVTFVQPARAAKIHLKLGNERLLNVGDDDGLGVLYEEGLDNTGLQVDLEWLTKGAANFLGNLLQI